MPRSTNSNHKTKPIENVKVPTISLYEMEISIAKLYGTRTHIIVPNISWGFNIHEIDLFIIKPSNLAVEVEIKRSLSDLKSDFKKGHNHVDKHNRINEFYYAIPIELLDKCIEYIPENAGIITCEIFRKQPKAKIYRSAKKIKGSRKLTTDEIVKITRLGCMRIMPLKEKIVKLLAR